MKKICILLAVLLMISVTGCSETNSEANTYVDKTFEAIEMGEFEVALKYGNTAIEKGNENEEFKKIVSLLEQYDDVMFWLKDGFVEEAKEKYEKITDYEDTAMESAFEELEKAIEDEAEKIEDEIENVQNLLDEKRFSEAEREADALLDDRHLTDEQIERVVDLWSEAVAGQKKTSPSPSKTPESTPIPGGVEINITPEQAEQFVRNQLGLSENAVVTVTLQGEYYQVNAITYYDDGIEDGVGCKVHVGDGTIYDLAG